VTRCAPHCTSRTGVCDLQSGNQTENAVFQKTVPDSFCLQSHDLIVTISETLASFVSIETSKGPFAIQHHLSICDTGKRVLTRIGSAILTTIRRRRAIIRTRPSDFGVYNTPDVQVKTTLRNWWRLVCLRQFPPMTAQSLRIRSSRKPEKELFRIKVSQPCQPDLFCCMSGWKA